jgi:hypothetical protein
MIQSSNHVGPRTSGRTDSRTVGLPPAPCSGTEPSVRKGRGDQQWAETKSNQNDVPRVRCPSFRAPFHGQPDLFTPYFQRESNSHLAHCTIFGYASSVAYT